MATLQDLKPCIDDGHMAIRQINDLMPEFVDRIGDDYVYQDSETMPPDRLETYKTFGDLLEIMEYRDTWLGIEESYKRLHMWDLLDIEDVEEEG